MRTRTSAGRAPPCCPRRTGRSAAKCKNPLNSFYYVVMTTGYPANDYLPGRTSRSPAYRRRRTLGVRGRPRPHPGAAVAQLRKCPPVPERVEDQRLHPFEFHRRGVGPDGLVQAAGRPPGSRRGRRRSPASARRPCRRRAASRRPPTSVRRPAPPPRAVARRPSRPPRTRRRRRPVSPFPRHSAGIDVDATASANTPRGSGAAHAVASSAAPRTATAVAAFAGGPRPAAAPRMRTRTASGSGTSAYSPTPNPGRYAGVHARIPAWRTNRCGPGGPRTHSGP